MTKQGAPGSLIPPAWQDIRVTPYNRGEIAGQCLAPLSGLDLDALPWDEKPSGSPERFRQITRVKHSTTRCVLSFLITDPDEIPVRVYAKRCRARDVLKRLMSVGRESKARREWQVGWEMLHRGLPTAAPVLWAEKRRSGMMVENYLVTLGIEGGVSFGQLYGSLATLEERCTWLGLLGANVRLGHENNFAHDDLSVEHVLVTTSDDVYRKPPVFHYIDLDGARIDSAVSAYRRAHNFFQIFRSLPAAQFGATERRAFYAGYSQGVWKEEHIAAFDKAIERIAFLKRLGRLSKPSNWFKR